MFEHRTHLVRFLHHHNYDAPTQTCYGLMRMFPFMGELFDSDKDETISVLPRAITMSVGVLFFPYEHAPPTPSSRHQL